MYRSSTIYVHCTLYSRVQVCGTVQKNYYMHCIGYRCVAQYKVIDISTSSNRCELFGILEDNCDMYSRVFKCVVQYKIIVICTHRLHRLRIHSTWIGWHLAATCCIQGLRFTTFKEILAILNIKHNVYEYCLFLKILNFLSKGSLNIPEYRCLLIGRVQCLYTIEHAVENIAYYRC